MKLPGRKKIGAKGAVWRTVLYAKLKRIYVTFARENFFSFFFEGFMEEEKNECKSQRNIKRRKSRGKRKMEQGATPSSSLRFISIKTEDRRCRNSNLDAGNCIHTHIQETSHLLSSSPWSPFKSRSRYLAMGISSFLACNFV